MKTKTKYTLTEFKELLFKEIFEDAPQNYPYFHEPTSSSSIFTLEEAAFEFAQRLEDAGAQPIEWGTRTINAWYVEYLGNFGEKRVELDRARAAAWRAAQEALNTENETGRLVAAALAAEEEKASAAALLVEAQQKAQEALEKVEAAKRKMDEARKAVYKPLEAAQLAVYKEAGLPRFTASCLGFNKSIAQVTELRAQAKQPEQNL